MNKLKNYFLRSLPNMFWPFKLFLIKTFLGKIGKNVKLPYDALFTNYSNIEIDDNVFIGKNFYCSVCKSLVIKSRVMFGANCSIIAGDHKYNDPTENMRFTSKLGDNRDIIIEEDCWIGHGTVILKKAFLAEGCIIGANSLVNEKLKPYSVYAGQPTHFIKPRFNSYEDLSAYLIMMKKKFNFESRYSEAELKNIYI